MFDFPSLGARSLLGRSKISAHLIQSAFHQSKGVSASESCQGEANRLISVNPCSPKYLCISMSVPEIWVVLDFDRDETMAANSGVQLHLYLLRNLHHVTEVYNYNIRSSLHQPRSYATLWSRYDSQMPARRTMPRNLARSIPLSPLSTTFVYNAFTRRC